MVEAMPPIVIEESGDIEVYPTVETARRAIEAIDVLDGIYKAFDSDGRSLLLVAYGNLVSIEVPENPQPDPAGLERRLREYIVAVGPSRVGVANLEDATLPVMLGALLKFQRGGKPERRKRWPLAELSRRFRRARPD